MADLAHDGTFQAPDVLVFKDYLAGREVGKSSTALFESAFAKPMELVAMREPAPSSEANCEIGALLVQAGITNVSVVVNDGIGVALMSHDDAVRFIDSTGKNPSRTLIRSYPFESMKHAHAQYEIMLYALRCIEHGSEEALAPTLWFLRKKVLAREDMSAYLHPALETLKKSDELNGTEYYKTVTTFLKHDSRAQRAGQELFLHRNAVLYRLKKIEELTGADLGDPQERDYLRFSFLLDKHLP